jgi:predicted RNase H-like HicB family nuclease
MTIEWSDEDEAYLVTLPEWEGRVFGPVSHGDTYEEAVKNGLDALTALIASAEKHGEPLPAPRVFAATAR